MTTSSTTLSRSFAALRPAQAAFVLSAAFALLHLLVAGRYDLGVDEAHYALYGRLLDLSYFDHPPMVGWLQALVLPFSSHELALRLWPIGLGAAAGGVLYLLTRELFPESSPWTAVAAVALLYSAVIFQLISLALVPEGPLLVFGLAAALFLFRAVRHDRLGDWLITGVLFGLAGLSKYTAVLLVVTAVVFIVWERRWMLLRRPGPWLAALLALALVAPVLWWNAHHDWISLAYQWGHGAPDREWQAMRLLRSLAGQLLAYAPGIVFFGLIAVAAARRELDHPGVRFSLALALPLLVLFAVGAGFEETLPHWTLLGWVALAPLTARWLLAAWPRRLLRMGVYASLVYSLLLIGIVHAQLLTPWLPFAAHRHPFGDLYGWRAAAERAAALRETRIADGAHEAQVFVGNWSLASRVAWYGGVPVQVTDKRFDQFDLWFGTPARGAEGILLVPENYADRPAVAGLSHFLSCRELETLPWDLGQQRVHTFRFYDCRGYRG